MVEVLVRNQGKLVSQRQLLQEVWGPEYHDETAYLARPHGQRAAQARARAEPAALLPHRARDGLPLRVDRHHVVAARDERLRGPRSRSARPARARRAAAAASYSASASRPVSWKPAITSPPGASASRDVGERPRPRCPGRRRSSRCRRAPRRRSGPACDRVGERRRGRHESQSRLGCLGPGAVEQRRIDVDPDGRRDPAGRARSRPARCRSRRRAPGRADGPTARPSRRGPRRGLLPRARRRRSRPGPATGRRSGRATSAHVGDPPCRSFQSIRTRAWEPTDAGERLMHHIDHSGKVSTWTFGPFAAPSSSWR